MNHPAARAWGVILACCILPLAAVGQASAGQAVAEQAGAAQSATGQAGAGPGIAARPAPRVSPRPLVVSLLLHDTLQPASAQMLHDELLAANAQHPAAILLDLSTPGGTTESASAMAGMIRDSAAPVLIDVYEPGTQVAGEGLRLLLAGAATVMNPDTRLIPLRQPRHRFRRRMEVRQAEIDALTQAVAAALSARGRDPALASSLMQGEAEITPGEALQAGFVDGVTPKEETALRTLTVAKPGGGPDLRGARVVKISMTTRQHLMRALMNPDLTVLLLTLGALLIFLEINTPGTVIPGAAGVLLVMLSLYGLLQMPLRWQGAALLLVSASMLFAETQFPRGSAYGSAAVAALTLGLRFLVRGPIRELEVDWSTSVGAGVGFGGITAGLVLLGVRARRAKQKVGADAMLGWLAVAQTTLRPTGEILVRGELWRARLSPGNAFLPAGECVRVLSTDGVTLEVAPMTLNLQDAERA